MPTKITRQGDVTIVRFEGHITYESIEPVLKETKKLGKEEKHTIVFNFKDARFVGSSNISTFIKAIKPLTKGKTLKATLCCLNEEFRKMFKAFQGKDPFEIFESENDALTKINI